MSSATDSMLSLDEEEAGAVLGGDAGSGDDFLALGPARPADREESVDFWFFDARASFVSIAEGSLQGESPLVKPELPGKPEPVKVEPGKPAPINPERAAAPKPKAAKLRFRASRSSASLAMADRLSCHKSRKRVAKCAASEGSVMALSIGCNPCGR
ncbi:MAG: hypothetical protein R3E60_07650 [Alphaproteobacteria bacterium]